MFLNFLGNCAIAGKQIAVERNGDEYKLTAETVGGGQVRYRVRDRNGDLVWRVVPPMTLSDAGYQLFIDRVERGLPSRSDARIVQRALIEMGYPADSFGHD